MIVTRGCPVSEWNTLTITSLFKKGDKSVPDNYRGLAVMGIMPKLFATMVNIKLESLSIN
jgi:hypothetical protein